MQRSLHHCDGVRALGLLALAATVLLFACEPPRPAAPASSLGEGPALAPETPVAPEAPLTPQAPLTPEAETLYRRTLVRDPEPTCATLEAGLARPVEALLEVTEVEAPPTSSVRAARCLVAHHATEVEPQLERWVRERASMGLGLVVLGALDQLDDALAARLAAAALAGEYPDVARRRIARVRPGLLEPITEAPEPSATTAR